MLCTFFFPRVLYTRKLSRQMRLPSEMAWGQPRRWLRAYPLSTSRSTWITTFAASCSET